MTDEDRNIFEERKLEILHITFVKNSEELEQKYFSSNLTTFSESGIEVFMNFSDPLLISAGQEADKVRIKMSKNFFLRPQAQVGGRYLATMT